MLPFPTFWAAVLLSASVPLHERIDQLIQAPANAALSDDAEFLRRVTLDLTGTIPTATDARAFLADAAPDKRAQLVDRLLASPQHARHMAIVFDVMLMDRRADSRVKTEEWRNFLRESFAANKPYDAMIREILAADGADPATRIPAKFVLDRNADSLQLARDVSRVFLGRNIQCAQCHDHPQIDDYKQDHFYGLQAFFNRTSVFAEGKDGPALAEKADGEVSFTNVFDKAKVVRMTGPRLPGGPQIAEPMLEKGKEYKVEPKKGVRSVPVFSRREQLPKVLTDNPAFARASVNRLWYLMLGRGIVHPLDMDHSDNPPSHPELLDLLAKEFAEHAFDFRYLLREIALSQTYQRSSIGEAEPESFHVAAVKPLSPETFAFAMMQATGLTDSIRLNPALDEPKLYAQLMGNVAPFVRTFGKQPGEVEDGSFVTTLEQTLFLRNGGVVRGWLPPRNGNLADRVLKLTDVNAQVDELFLSVLTRLPDADERAEVAAQLQASSPNRAAQLSELIWALVTSAEFRFNH